MERLSIELEDVGGTSWWASILTTLTSTYGSSQQRFVGKVGGKTLYKSRTFSSPRPISPTPPQEEWAPGMEAALEELKQDLATDGWVRTGRGEGLWSGIYERKKRQTPR